MQTAPTMVIVISFVAIERFEKALNIDIHPVSVAHATGWRMRIVIPAPD
jgi:hypothetical protein